MCGPATKRSELAARRVWQPQELFSVQRVDHTPRRGGVHPLPIDEVLAERRLGARHRPWVDGGPRRRHGRHALAHGASTERGTGRHSTAQHTDTQHVEFKDLVRASRGTGRVRAVGPLGLGRARSRGASGGTSAEGSRRPERDGRRAHARPILHSCLHCMRPTQAVKGQGGTPAIEHARGPSLRPPSGTRSGTGRQ